jgi:thiamine-phosphate pyrophosphorylase
MKSLAECYLYTFLDTAYLGGRPVREVARALCEGGSDIIQLRAKSSTPSEIRKMAEDILKITQPAGIPLVINDHFGIARDLKAEACHLGQEDFFEAGFSHVSDLCGPSGRPLFGLSTHSPEQARKALAADPDYVAIGAVYATPTKPTARPVTLDYVKWAAANIQKPWFAIGGINLLNARDVLAAGAQRICVLSAILTAPDIARACREFKQILSESKKTKSL